MWKTRAELVPRWVREMRVMGHSVTAANSPRPCGPSSRADRSPVKAPIARSPAWAKTVNPRSRRKRDLKSRGISKARRRPVKADDSEGAASIEAAWAEMASFTGLMGAERLLGGRQVVASFASQSLRLSPYPRQQGSRRYKSSPTGDAVL